MQHQNPDKVSLVKAFEFALNQEETGKSFFAGSLQRMGIGAAVAAFKKLINEEEKHIEFIKAILVDLNEHEEIAPSTLAADDRANSVSFFDARAKAEFLEKCLDESMIPDVTVFNVAYLIERDLSEFYTRMSENTDNPGARDAFAMLARWEKGHEQFFKDYRDKLSGVYSKMPWGG
ncbi:MAG: ferritin family protein [Thermodesulfobacteriota bacterium]|nr:ferritin family protein [Thermodesulfobacteriota bacterium]